jgi:glycine/D-amino acid oxidase-like deaminating enzyme
LVKVAFGESDLPELQETLDLFNEADGFEAHWLGPAAVAELEPRITSDVIAGVYARGNAALDSYKYTLALADAGKKLGASFRPGRVCGVEKANGRVTGVLLEDGKLACEHLVLAMGPWSRRAEAWLDSYIPVDPLKGELLRTRLPGVTLAHDLSGGGGSLHPKPDGRIWCGTTEEWRGYDKQPSDSARDAILQGAIKLVPEMAQAQVVEHTACLRPVTPDWLPILGRAPGWENVYLATGAGKKGILLSPGMGKAVADLVTRRVSDLPVEGFSPSRFAGPPD